MVLIKKASFEVDTKRTFSNGLTNDSSQKSELSSLTFVNYKNSFFKLSPNNTFS